MQKSVPLCEVHLDCKYLDDKVDMGVCSHLPIDDVHIILGNDLCACVVSYRQN